MRLIILLITIGFATIQPMYAIGFKSIPQQQDSIKPPFLSVDTKWVDSVMATMSPDDRIAQLMMVATYSNKPVSHSKTIATLIKDYKIGGLIFMQGGPIRQAQLTNYYQSVSEIPLFIAMDAEWGLSMRLDSTIYFPRQVILGAIQNNQLIYETGVEIAKHCRRLGVHVNFAPVIDVNNNKNNPVIGYRSFGEDPENVAQKGYFFMKGMQDNKVLACGKHFPGHGDTDVDSHVSLPVINHSKERLDSIELYPFKQLIGKGLGSIMIAHLYVPSLDNTKNTATTLSSKVVNDLLINDLGFTGLIFTDALNMGGVANYYQPGEVDVKALLAGNDVLLFPQNVPVAIKKIREAINNGEISQEEVDRRCRKILMFKKWVELDKNSKIDIKNLHADLNPASSKILINKLYENALTLVKNDNKLIPLKRLDTLKIASVVIGDKKFNSYQKTLSLYTNVEHFSISKTITPEESTVLLKKLSAYNLVIVGFHGTNRSVGKNFGITSQSIDFVSKLANMNNVIISVFANPYSLEKLKNTNKIKGIIVAYQDLRITNELAAKLIFGGVTAKGKLPVSGGILFPAGTGITAENSVRINYLEPDELGINIKSLNKIDSLINNAISKKVIPGCQLLIAKNGNVFYNKAYGFQTYDSLRAVETSDLYDLASLTKILATTPSLMKLEDEKKFSADSAINIYLPYLDTTNKKGIKCNKILAHEAKLASWIPFYKKTIANDSIRNFFYSSSKIADYSIEVGDKMFMHNAYRDSVFIRIGNSALRKKPGYKYSDLGFYLFYQLVEKITNVPFGKFTDSVFYSRLGANNLVFNPLEKYPKEIIAPTENDTFFRRQLIQGYVHDYGAAMLGGVCGHAGLFGNANDIAKLLQMFLNKGEYGGEKYLEPEIVEKYTSCFNCPKNRRGLGFDKPQVTASESGPASKSCPRSSYGHSGFTGTFAWVDPENKLIYVFLSNRIYPDIENKQLISTGLRTDIMEIIYESFK
ncbi:MAG: serine hydrolase [Bacteroidales bacterium]|nr:serine hydrolase [Bacteroidales bacterium]